MKFFFFHRKRDKNLRPEKASSLCCAVHRFSKETKAATSFSNGAKNRQPSVSLSPSLPSLSPLSHLQYSVKKINNGWWRTYTPTSHCLSLSLPRHEVGRYVRLINHTHTPRYSLTHTSLSLSPTLSRAHTHSSSILIIYFYLTLCKCTRWSAYSLSLSFSTAQSPHTSHICFYTVRRRHQHHEHQHQQQLGEVGLWLKNEKPSENERKK